MTHVALPHDGGLRAFIHGGKLPGALPADLAAISADRDADLTFLAGCYDSSARDLPRPLMAAEACTELGAGTAPTRLGLLRLFHVAVLERRLDIVRDERDRYERLGAIGPTYHRNSLVLQLQLMARIRELRG